MFSSTSCVKTLLTIVLILAYSDAIGGEWKRLSSLPDKEGFAGSFAGVSNGALIVAGGTNFPDKKLWEGGTKVWYDTVLVLQRPNGEWKAAGKLPRPLGYGVSTTYGEGVVCVGGSDDKRHYADVFRLVWRDGKVVVSNLPPLPHPVANASGAMVGDVLYVACGLAKPDSKNTLSTAWAIDLSSAKPQWTAIEPCPGSGRMLAVASSLDGAFWLVGGVDLSAGKGESAERRYLKDGYRYDSRIGWKRIADLPHPIAAAASPAPVDATGYYILGGDDGSQVATSPAQSSRV